MIRRSFIQTIAGAISAGLCWGRDKISERRIPSPTGWDLLWTELPDSPTSYGAWMAVPQTAGRSVAFRTLAPRAQGTERMVNVREVAVADYVHGQYGGSRELWADGDSGDKSFFAPVDSPDDLIGEWGPRVHVGYEVWDIEHIPAPQSVLYAAKRDGRARLIELIKTSKNAASIEDCCKAGLMPMAFVDYFNTDGTKKQIAPPGFVMTEAPTAMERERDAEFQAVRDATAASPLGVIMTKTFSDLWRGCEYPQVIRCGEDAFAALIDHDGHMHYGLNRVRTGTYNGLSELKLDTSIPARDIWFENQNYPAGSRGELLYNRKVELPAEYTL